MKFILLLVAILFGLNCYMSKSLPEPWAFYDSYGFEVGQRYTMKWESKDPFDKQKSCDTIKVVSIKGNFIQYAKRGEVSSFNTGSLVAMFNDFERVK